jgi:hypothetical protein
MRRAFYGLLCDLDVMTIALAIPIGWSLYQVAHGLSTVVDYAAKDYGFGSIRSAELPALAWSIDGHILYLEPLVSGLVELAAVLAVAAFVHAKFANPQPDSAPPPTD